MRTAILVLSVDEAHRLESCLPAALAQDDAEVVVVDNACTDGTAALCARLGVRTVRLEERRSYAAAVNAGLRAVAGRDVLLLNADCLVPPGFLARLRAALERDPGLGSVAPKLVRMLGPGEPLDLLDTAAMVVDRRRKNGLNGHGQPAGSFGAAGPCFGGDGACVLYRAAALAACTLPGGEVLDEDMELWASDVDLAWRAQRLGWTSWYEPAAVAHHQRFYSPTTRAGLSPAHRRLQFRNRLLMILKNDTWRTLARDLPWVLGYEVLALGHVLLRERALLGGYGDAWRLRAGARRRRRQLSAARPARRPPFGLRPRP